MYPQKSSKNSKKRRRGEGRRLFETFPKNSTFFMSFPRDYLFLSLFLTQMFSIWYQHICMWFCLRDPDFRGVFFWTFRSFFSSNFPEYFSEFCGGIFSEFSRVFFQIFSIFLNLSTKIKWRPSFFVVTSIFPNSYEYFLTFLTEFPEYFFRILGIFQNFSTIIKWRPFFLFLVLTSIFPEFPEHFQNFEYFP